MSTNNYNKASEFKSLAEKLMNILDELDENGIPYQFVGFIEQNGPHDKVVVRSNCEKFAGTIAAAYSQVTYNNYFKNIIVNEWPEKKESN